MPGIVRGMAATAVVAGTAQATRNAVNRRQAEKNVKAYSEATQSVQPQPAPAQPAQPQTAPATDDPAEKLKKLADLHDKGILTDKEFTTKKQEILAQM